MGQQLIDETGNKYGSLTVLTKTKDKNNRTAWLCQCECGNQKIVRGSDLRKGKITSCAQPGCFAKEKRNTIFIDETGNKYGKLIVLYKDKEKSPSKKIKWICQCECGNICSIMGESLRQGSTISCGCYQKESSRNRRTKDLTNMRFGKLTAMYNTKTQSKDKGWIWWCKCDCGNFTKVKAADLLSGNTKSCGCLISWGEQKINSFLLQQNISFQPQYHFNDLQSENNKYFRFDFALFDQHNNLVGLIEYHGEQHFAPIKAWGGEERFKKNQKYDQIKKLYCQTHNIPILYLTKKDENYQQQILNFYQVNGGTNG